MRHQFKERAVPGLGIVEVCQHCGVIRRRRSKAVPWSYFRATDKEPIGHGQPACHKDAALTEHGECAYCFGDGFVVDIEEVTWPCPQGCKQADVTSGVKGLGDAQQ
jgi:endonuclease III